MLLFWWSSIFPFLFLAPATLPMTESCLFGYSTFFVVFSILLFVGRHLTLTRYCWLTDHMAAHGAIMRSRLSFPITPEQFPSHAGTDTAEREWVAEQRDTTTGRHL